MKYLFFLLGGILSISAQAQLTTLGVKTNLSTIPLQKISLSGTVEVDESLSPASARARTSMLNAKRILEEFSVSKNDYELVIDINGPGSVGLVPKSASAGLPTIEVFTLGNTAHDVIDTTGNFADLVSTLSSTATGNLFEGLGGEIRGRITFKGAILNGILKNFTFSVDAFGKNQDGIGSTDALLRFKVATTGDFVQKP